MLRTSTSLQGVIFAPSPRKSTKQVSTYTNTEFIKSLSFGASEESANNIAKRELIPKNGAPGQELNQKANGVQTLPVLCSKEPPIPINNIYVDSAKGVLTSRNANRVRSEIVFLFGFPLFFIPLKLGMLLRNMGCMVQLKRRVPSRCVRLLGTEEQRKLLRELLVKDELVEVEACLSFEEGAIRELENHIPAVADSFKPSQAFTNSSDFMFVWARSMGLYESGADRITILLPKESLKSGTNAGSNNRRTFDIALLGERDSFFRRSWTLRICS
ncbi:unnamed protein product [Lepeophtheirus salmonis]|uniref:(salmon louse) hypothetical protein n=1 Tax=Lepeophtheirus salmonis TaxID=72036 RepID=A0A7R8HCR1_LEPSM|nr:unnamed protein product [Lepeophtheirus salmonis]CAF3009863.1 unnamed protein product [Lepeophtheirus salmonis]